MTFDDLRALMQRLSDAITCAEIEREEAKRTVLVPDPASAVKLEAWLATHGLDDVITVECSRHLPPNTWIVIDVRAIEASTAEAMQAMAREALFETKRNSCCGWEVGTGHGARCSINFYTWGMRTLNPTAMIRITGT